MLHAVVEALSAGRSPLVDGPDAEPGAIPLEKSRFPEINTCGEVFNAISESIITLQLLGGSRSVPLVSLTTASLL